MSGRLDGELKEAEECLETFSYISKAEADDEDDAETAVLSLRRRRLCISPVARDNGRCTCVGENGAC